MLKTLDVTNFTCFPKAKLEFSPGLNVIVGENGTGKSHLLKLGYAALEALNKNSEDLNSITRQLNISGIEKELPIKLVMSFERIFGDIPTALLSHNKESGKIQFSTYNGDIISVEFTSKIIDEENMIPIQTFIDSETVQFTEKKSVFIPPKEIISVFFGFQAALENREFDFDGTYLDLAKLLNSIPIKENKIIHFQNYIKQIKSILKGEFTFDGQRFYFTEDLSINGKQPRSYKAAMSAEGHRKIGMLAWLIKNGSLKEGSSLFWDEPEANLNPKLLKALAAILVELSSIMQITIATHSLFFVRELEILQENKQLKNAKYFGLHFNEDGNGVNVTQGDSPNHMGDIVALDEEIEQSSRYLNMGE